MNPLLPFSKIALPKRVFYFLKSSLCCLLFYPTFLSSYVLGLRLIKFIIFMFLVFIILLRIYVLPFVLYGCATWSLTLREECRLRVLENKVLRRIETGSGHL
jgi:hypothetical protein